MSLAELRNELRELRRGLTTPVSRMKKADVALELERHKVGKASKNVVGKPVKEEDEESVEVKPVKKPATKPKKVVEEEKTRKPKEEASKKKTTPTSVKPKSSKK